MAKKLPFDTSKAENLAQRLLERLPNKDSVREQIGRIEHRVLTNLKERMAALEQPTSTVSVVAVQVTASRRSAAKTPADIMQGLLGASSEQSHDEALAQASLAILRTLLPDEARILAALGDGARYPLIHLYSGAKIGLSAYPVLEYVSSVGRMAGVLAPELTPLYVRRLTAQGLTEMHGEDYSLQTGYELLETDDGVRKAIARIEQSGERVRVVRRTLVASELGQKIWAACAIVDADLLPKK